MQVQTHMWYLQSKSSFFLEEWSHSEEKDTGEWEGMVCKDTDSITDNLAFPA